MVFEKVRDMIASQLQVAPESITMESRLVEDLKADSANVMVMILEMETGMVWLPAMVRASIKVSYLSSLLTRCFNRTATLKLLVWEAGPM